MKLGYINYLNCYPLYYEMMEKRPVSGVQLIPGYPSELNEMMRNEELDISPVSSAAYADIQDEVMILPEFCLGSVGYVRSVILVSNVPIEDLDGKTIGLSRASQTSVVLLKSLLKQYYHIDPIYQPSDPLPVLRDLDAALIIGNEAMTRNPEAVPYVYDLGDLWLRKTGFPVVFAVFVVRKKAMREQPETLKAIISSYHKSLGCLETERDIFIRKAGEKYPNIAYDISTYFRLIKYEFTQELKDALRFYFSVAGASGFLRQVNTLEFIPDSI
ncbi:menaquinone biosynthesis protein [Desulfonema magnum]|uniref:Chorismate dehydratase n=1 Tax=Desulfonema magnum TaxID=45655 RepID=A0A975GQD7_9BACT|nr:menaquinone biosynthesis protein [Desulfonema magnum]QTA89772.1 Menaquinone biosynthesis protein [Desulfonema magnum]